MQAKSATRALCPAASFRPTKSGSPPGLGVDRPSCGIFRHVKMKRHSKDTLRFAAIVFQALGDRSGLSSQVDLFIKICLRALAGAGSGVPSQERHQGRSQAFRMQSSYGICRLHCQTVVSGGAFQIALQCASAVPACINSCIVLLDSLPTPCAHWKGTKTDYLH